MPLPPGSDAPPRAPSGSVPPLSSRATRRTCHLDVTQADGHRLEIRGAATDRGGDRTGDRVELSAAVRLDDGRWLDALRAAPPHPGLEGLVGAALHGGFRARVAALLGQDDRGSPLAQLLHDLPTITYLNGYAVIRRRVEAGDNPGAVVPPEVLPAMADLCSGWRTGGVMTSSVREGRGVPLQDAPPAPPLDDLELPPLAVGAVRRARRIDLETSAGTVDVDAWFRDTYAGPDGSEVVLHEYVLGAEFDGSDRLVRAIDVAALVLPFPECPWAAGTLPRLLRVPAAELRAAASHRLDGTDGCTHLNDLIASVGEVVAHR